MAIEKNVVFLYPISKVLQELKEELENDDEYMVYELDSVAEYGQLIGVMEHSVTFSTDLKKTESYLDESKQFVKTKNAKNFLVTDKTLPPHIFGKLQKLGLNETIKSDVNLKNLNHKINFFFNTFEQEEKKIEEEKNKATMETSSSSKQVIGSGEKKKEVINTNERLRVEKMATMDDGQKDLRMKKSKHSFDLNTMLGGGSLSNFEMSPNKNKKNPFLKSPFDSFQLKKVKTFDPVQAANGLKRSNFKPVNKEYGNNPHKDLGLSPQGELRRKKSKDFQAQNADLPNKRKKFEEVEQSLNRKKVNFEDQNNNLNRKRKDFEAAEVGLKKKRAQIEDLDPANPKRKKFEEVEADYKKKRGQLDELEDNLGKKRKEFEEVELELEKKKVQLDEFNDDHKEKPKLLLEMEELQKKKLKTLDEIDLELKKKKAFIEEELEPKKLKKLELEDFADEQRHKKVDFGDIDYDEKKGADFEHEDLGLKRKKFEEVDPEAGKKRDKFEEAQLDTNRKNSKFEEVELDKKRSNAEFENKMEQKKKSGFEEVKNESKFKDLNNFVIGGSSKAGQEIGGEEDKNYDEQTLDYSKFKKNKKTGVFEEEESEEEKFAREKLEGILEEPEYNFFPNDSFGVEYLVIYNDFLLQDEIKNDNLFKFIHFGLIKEFEADVSFYLSDISTPDIPTKQLYSGHTARGNKILGGEFEEFEKENYSKWIDCKLPTWKDETYQVDINEFVYPYFEDGELLGLAICHFKGTVKNHGDAKKVELLIMSLKGAILEEISLNRK